MPRPPEADKLLCISDALNTYKERFERDRDLNPMIVQIKVDGKTLIPHWYYRSGMWIRQPSLIPIHLIQPYIGPADEAYPPHYGEGTYVVDEIMTNIALKMVTPSDS